MKRIKISVTVILLLLALFSLNYAEGAVTKKCFCSYYRKTFGNWSEEYELSVTFLSGEELNKKTGSFSAYNSNELYAVIWFKPEQCAIVGRYGKFQGLIYHSVGGSDFTESKFNQYVNGKILKGYDRDETPWQIRVPNY